MKFFLPLVLLVNISYLCYAQDNIYHKNWIDFNKNGKKDVYEDPTKTVDERVNDLVSQMTIEEKTNQTATLYGYGRVLKDEMPTAEWKSHDLAECRADHHADREVDDVATRDELLELADHSHRCALLLREESSPARLGYPKAGATQP